MRVFQSKVTAQTKSHAETDHSPAPLAIAKRAFSCVFRIYSPLLN